MSNKKTATSNTTIGPWSIPDGPATIFIKAVDWDGATCQIKFADPDGEMVADTNHSFTSDTVKVIEAGAFTTAEAEFTGGGVNMEISVNITG